MIELLTPDEMGRADAMTIAAGTPGIELMENAGKAVADAVLERYPNASRICCLAGPGNNGGDAFIAARLLVDAGRAVTMSLFGSVEKLHGDAAIAAQRWRRPVETAAADGTRGFDVIVDGLFGAGLTRPIEGPARFLVDAINGDPAAKIAIDLPSGVNGETGKVQGIAVKADQTMTFFRMKPGHFLFPGKTLCGDVTVADIGILPETLDEIAPQTWVNDPALWRTAWKPPTLEGHKYTRGHAVVVSGPMISTGAARLAANAALRAGAGLVTLASPPGALMVNASHLTAVMVRPFKKTSGLAELLRDKRLNVVAIGPGAGATPETRDLVTLCLESERPLVLDADALSCFSGDPKNLFRLISDDDDRDIVLTPHEGEFARLFSIRDITGPVSLRSKVGRARAAAKRSGATIVLKGPDTVIAAPDGRAAINANAPAWLATAGSGDVLTGLVTGLLAQRMPAFEAASMAVWLHGAAAASFGPGMIAEDIGAAVPAAIQSFCVDGAP